jgi:prepilin-type N-terminal cleavage/methylation domain-containing protein
VRLRLPARAGGGFTLLEILIVLTVIGIVTAIAVPRLNLGRMRVDGAARGASSLLLRAQRTAVAAQHDVNVLFNLPANAIKLHEDADNDNVIDATERVRSYPLGEGVVFGRGGAPVRIYRADSVSFTRRLDGMPELIFRRDGSASEGGGFYLSAARPGGRDRPPDTRSVEVVRSTGRPEWYRYGPPWARKF